MKVKIEQNAEGEAFLAIPQELLDELKWEEGDNLEWLLNDDGNFCLRKVKSTK